VTSGVGSRTIPAHQAKAESVMKLKLMVAVAVIILALAGAIIFTHKPAAPDVGFNTLQGQTFRTTDLRGKVVLVNFWATTCTTCIKEMPGLQATHEKFTHRGFETVAVAMDYDPPAQVAAYVERSALPFTFVLDRDGGIAHGFESVRLTPTTYLINKRGEIVQKILGEPDFGKLHALIEQLLAEPV
jgi:peroxiredoxin